jgi:hypothetical protein
MNVDRILTNLKTIDCPPDSLRDKIKDACAVPGIGGDPAVVVDREESMDRGDLQAYNIHIINTDTPSIVAMVREGYDGYVTTVIDAFPENE